jgi:uncharacterized metal-binding protein YceD (DUF177 family)
MRYRGVTAKKIATTKAYMPRALRSLRRRSGDQVATEKPGSDAIRPTLVPGRKPRYVVPTAVTPRHAFSVKVADLEYGDREIDEEIPVSWLEKALAGSEATPRGRPGRLSATVAKSGRDVMVRGRATAAVSMPCSRTLDPVDVDLDVEIFLLLTPASPGPFRGEKRPRKQKTTAPKKVEKEGRKGPKVDAREESLDDSDAARDTYDGEDVVLDDFVREFLVLELPMFPLRPDLRSDEPTGICEPPLTEAPAGQSGKEIDPRLAPLAAIASRLSEKNFKKE